MNEPRVVVVDDPAAPEVERELSPRERVQQRHNEYIVGRIPLYAKALGALRAAVVGGAEPKTLRWVKEFAPLTRAERETVLQRFLEKYGTEATRS